MIVLCGGNLFGVLSCFKIVKKNTEATLQHQKYYVRSNCFVPLFALDHAYRLLYSHQVYPHGQHAFHFVDECYISLSHLTLRPREYTSYRYIINLLPFNPTSKKTFGFIISLKGAHLLWTAIFLEDSIRSTPITGRR